MDQSVSPLIFIIRSFVGLSRQATVQNTARLRILCTIRVQYRWTLSIGMYVDTVQLDMVVSTVFEYRSSMTPCNQSPGSVVLFHIAYNKSFKRFDPVSSLVFSSFILVIITHDFNKNRSAFEMDIVFRSSISVDGCKATATAVEYCLFLRD